VKTYPVAAMGGAVLYSAMFLRKLCRKKDGKSHHYWALVESYRTARGPRQRVVSYLGDMDEAERLGVQQAARNHPGQQTNLQEESPAPEWVEVNVNAVRTERSRRFGDVWLALELLRKLQLTDFFQTHLKSKHAKISWADLAKVLVVARFCEPKSELHIAEHFYHETALADLLGIPEAEIYANRLYRALDQLLKHKEQLEKHLKERLGELFEMHYEIILYDITSTYFEGTAQQNAQAQHGYSRDHRPDCKQVLIALVVTREGLPLGYEVFEGNKHDSKTVATIINKIEKLYGKSDRIWIMDRGMTSAETLVLLRQEQRRYIIGTPKSMLKHFESALAENDWQKVYDDLEVKLCASPFEATEEVFIVCRSATRQAKEQAMHERFRARLEAGLERVQKCCEQGSVDRAQAERRLGRLLQRYSRASAFFKITVKERKGKVKLKWSKHEPAFAWARLSEGCYVLRSNIIAWTAEDLWQAYAQLSDVEAAFRLQKGDLKLRPIWHQKEARVKAHILVCFLAYVLWKSFGQMCKQAGLGDEPRQVIAEIKKLQLTDVILPTRNGVELRLRCVSKPDRELALLLHKLKLNPPSRLALATNL
jgi:transposase